MTDWNPAGKIASVLFPGRGHEGMPLPLRWLLHGLAWSGVLAGMWCLNRALGMERVLRSPWPILHAAWLPLLALGVYALGWLGRGMWLALERAPATGVWPDVESAWDETRAALERAGIDFQQTPLFLLLGPLSGDVRAWLESLGAAPVAHRADAPFHAFIHPHGVILVCDRLSRLRTTSLPGEVLWTDVAKNDEHADRLRHLCERLTDDRIARLPLHGVVVAIPASALESAASVQSMIARMQGDLSIVRAATGLEVPLYLALHGLEPDANAAATAWFQRFPPQPDLDRAAVPRMFEAGVRWLFEEKIPADLRGRFRLDPAAALQEMSASAMRHNLQLFRWQCTLQSWRAHVVRLLTEGMQTAAAEPGMVAGCYFLAAGSVSEALWHDLLAHQHAAAWTADALADFADLRRRTRLGYLLGVAGWCLCGTAVAALFSWRF